MRPDMAETFARAAKGDVDAQAAMLDHMVGFAISQPLLTAEYLNTIEVWARMLMTHGRPCDAHRLAGVLLFRSSVCRSIGVPEAAELLAGEGMRILGCLASEGDQFAADKRATVGDLIARGRDVPPSIMIGITQGTRH
jgi:hypothetical protein